MRLVYGLAGMAWVLCGLAAVPPKAAGAPAPAIEVVIEPTSEEAGEAPAANETVAKRSAKGGGAPAPSAPTDTPEEIKAKFTTFCAGWVDKLRDREKLNIEKIKWETAPQGLVGEYVGYDTINLGAQTVEHFDTVPIGKLEYVELKLRRSGRSKEEALAAKPEIVERTEVLEIFRFDKGAWVF